MDPYDALVSRLEPHKGRVEWARDEIAGAIVFVRRDMPHLDADALNDRLAAWARRDVEPRVPHASAFVSFRHARPATEDESELAWQDEWVGLEPTFRLEFDRRPPTGSEMDAFAAFVPAFLAQVEATGRPAGWRRIDEGNAE